MLTIGNDSTTSDFALNHNIQKSVTTQNDLGVLIDHKLSFEEHIINKVNKANKILALIRRSFLYIDNKTFVNLYISLVSHLEYCVEVWYPHLKKHVDLLENVQRRSARLLPHLRQLSYPERLKLFNLPALVYGAIEVI